jgi:hypothetical protein
MSCRSSKGRQSIHEKVVDWRYRIDKNTASPHQLLWWNVGTEQAQRRKRRMRIEVEKEVKLLNGVNDEEGVTRSEQKKEGMDGSGTKGQITLWRG